MTDDAASPMNSGMSPVSGDPVCTIRDGDGVPIAHYEHEWRSGRPWAADLSMDDEVTTVNPRVVSLVATTLAGWGATAIAEVAGPFIANGAQSVRVFHTYTMNLTDSSATIEPDLRPGLRAVPARNMSAAALRPALSAAYPPSHPDFDSEAFAALDGLYDGTLMGPLSPCSTTVVEGHRVVAAALVNDTESDGPWLSEIFRVPEPQFAGLGTALLQIVIAQATAAGLPTLGLSVTDSNPARTVYERIGFRRTGTWMDFIFPAPGVEP
ncbi:GNAT family N-acetyltransferase [Nocardia sp. NBC_00511]|uniref:GNAT family N-acetyltransferase n=1 Tax=Nocardia sp. NBC_00511 TaxID=2903591 RepID=UPI0030E2A5B5